METETVFPERKTMSGCRLLVLKTTASGDCLFFEAEVYRYLKNQSRKNDRLWA